MPQFDLSQCDCKCVHSFIHLTAMTQAISKNSPQFSESAPTANPVFYRTYSRKTKGLRESLGVVLDRAIQGLTSLGHLTPSETDLLERMFYSLKSLPSGRWLWVGGTEWLLKPENFSGAYNCTSLNIVDWKSFGLMMNLAMMGCGTGAVLEECYIRQLPPICNTLNVKIIGATGKTPISQRQERTCITDSGKCVEIRVGDSREGWVDAYQTILELASDKRAYSNLDITVDLSDVRPEGEPLNGFGGVANPIKLAELYPRITAILNRAVGRQLTALECCLLIDEAAVVVVAGNVRRSAGLRQFSSNDQAAATAKDHLWSQDENGTWRIDPDRDALRMANHTRVFHQPPTLNQCLESVRKQFFSGEGAIQYAAESIARSNVDLFRDTSDRLAFIHAYRTGQGARWIHNRKPEMPDLEIKHRLERYALNPCGEIASSQFHCNLGEVHLNLIDPNNLEEQKEAFIAAALSVAVLLNHTFVESRFQTSRELDPIVGVSFTGLFDFFVKAFGIDWLRWWKAGRPNQWGKKEFTAPNFAFAEGTWSYQSDFFRQAERFYLTAWKEVVHTTVWNYCDRHHLRRPNRCTTVQPSGTKSLLTGASPGWHPPKAQRFLRRITFGKNDPVAQACLDYGYSVIPSQSDKDEQGRLLENPFDPRCSEWLVEIPVEVSWANLPGADEIAIENFPALAQFDFYMQIQRFYTTHNTSATIELREPEIEPLAHRIFEAIQSNEGYVSAALLARFDNLETYPRLPFEPISKSTYQQLQHDIRRRRKTNDFYAALLQYDQGIDLSHGPAGCDSDRCLFEANPNK
ncbi:ribonucleoside-triphosphate reductase, adenosylcobalamin-dependent [Leptolyngbya sp. AN03gr2]|uniref:ribonucleoside-triphosphate reductase, adenosylcobalamin-dependent n=1 Tax=unclassified Leptolyngbya TaxID=2650499 RepID=UPI003D3196F1